MATDAQLNTYCSALILKYLNTYFTSTAITDYIDGGDHYLVTSVAPIISITSITDTANNDTVVTASTYDFYAKEGLIYLDSGLDTFTNDVSNFNWGVGKRRYKVIYQAGYTAVPDDVVLATNLLITYYRNRSDISVNKQDLGDFSTSYAGSVYGMPPEVKAILDPYRVRSM
jgi:hypothetical protein